LTVIFFFFSQTWSPVAVFVVHAVMNLQTFALAKTAVYYFHKSIPANNNCAFLNILNPCFYDSM